MNFRLLSASLLSHFLMNISDIFYFSIMFPLFFWKGIWHGIHLMTETVGSEVRCDSLIKSLNCDHLRLPKQKCYRGIFSEPNWNDSLGFKSWVYKLGFVGSDGWKPAVRGKQCAQSSFQHSFTSTSVCTGRLIPITLIGISWSIYEEECTLLQGRIKAN